MNNSGFLFAAIPVLLVLMIVSGCGSSSDSGGTQLQPPLFNLTGTWRINETVGTNNGGIAVGTQMTTAYIVATHQAGSNTVVIRDTRSSDPQNATLSGNVFSYSGPRYSEFGCTNMNGTYTLTVTGSGGVGTSMTGSGSLTCLDNGASGQTTVTATKQ